MIYAFDFWLGVIRSIPEPYGWVVLSVVQISTAYWLGRLSRDKEVNTWKPSRNRIGRFEKRAKPGFEATPHIAQSSEIQLKEFQELPMELQRLRAATNLQAKGPDRANSQIGSN